MFRFAAPIFLCNSVDCSHHIAPSASAIDIPSFDASLRSLIDQCQSTIYPECTDEMSPSAPRGPRYPIRLPQYMALRFNLRIANVHRGLLLGTGPLIDPEFDGDILIPIHNLTDQDYTLQLSEGLIWVEFTKTSSKPNPNWKYKLESRKTLLTAESYLEKANQNNPIRSSISSAIAKVEREAADATKAAGAARRYLEQIFTIGALAIAALVITAVMALHSYFGTMAQLAGSVQSTASTALTKAEEGSVKGQENRKSLDEMKAALEQAQQEIAVSQREIASLRDALNAIRSSQPAPLK